MRAAYGVTASDLVDALGTPSFYLSRDDYVGGAMVAPLADPDPVETALETVPRGFAFADETAVHVGDLPRGLPESTTGFRLRVPPFLEPVNFAGDGERGVIAVGDDELRSALDPHRTIGESGRLDDIPELEGYELALFADPTEVLDTIARFDRDRAIQLDQVRPFLEGVTVVGGSRVDGDELLGRIVVELGDELTKTSGLRSSAARLRAAAPHQEERP
jgi:hypothetical protein